MANSRKSYPSDVSDDEWSLVMPYLTLMTEDAPQREFYGRLEAAAGSFALVEREQDRDLRT